jgi:hypothetical protein
MLTRDKAARSKADAKLSYGVAAAGTIVPPTLTNFGIAVGLDGGINGIVTFNATAGVRNLRPFLALLSCDELYP